MDRKSNRVAVMLYEEVHRVLDRIMSLKLETEGVMLKAVNTISRRES